MYKEVNPFTNIQDIPIQGGHYGADFVNLNTLEAGSGTKVMRADESGLWLGAEKWDDAPFRVDMEGNSWMTSATISGVLLVGQAAGDVNTGATQVEFSKIDNVIITNAMITSLAAEKITSQITNTQILSVAWAKITSVSIETADIEDAAITNAKIDSVNAGKITSQIVNAQIASIEWAKIDNVAIVNADIVNLSAEKLTAGVLYIGGTSQPSYIQIKRDNSSGGNAYLRWEGGSKMWSDTNNDIGINAIGGEMYFYMNSAQIFYLDDNSQAIIGQDNGTYDVGLFVWGNLNNKRGDVRFADAQVRINTSSSPSEQLYVEGSGKFVGNLEANHIDPRSSNSYNLGGSSQYWAYLNVKEISKQGGGGFGVFDDGVEMQDGRILPDTEALLEMKPDPVRKTDYGKPEFDMNTIPKAVRHMPEKDNAGNKIYKKNGRHFSKVKRDVWDDKKEDYVSKVVEEEHYEGERVFVMMSIMMGAIRELTLRVKELEAEKLKVPANRPVER